MAGRDGGSNGEVAESGCGGALETFLGSCTEAAPLPGGVQERPCLPQRFLPPAPLRKAQVGDRTPHISSTGARQTSLWGPLSGSVPWVTNGLRAQRWVQAAPPVPWGRPAPFSGAGTVKAQALLPQQKRGAFFPDAPPGTREGEDWVGVVGRDPPLRGPSRLGPWCPWAGLEPPPAGAAGLSAVSICSRPVLPPSPRRLPHLPRPPGRFFRWKPALPRPTLIKAWRKGREFLPAQVSPPSQFPTCSALLPGRARESCRDPGPGRGRSGSPCPVQLPHSYIGRQAAGAYRGLLKVGTPIQVESAIWAHLLLSGAEYQIIASHRPTHEFILKMTSLHSWTKLEFGALPCESASQMARRWGTGT